MSVWFKPHMQVLPLAQKRLWPELGHALDLGFTLYGGTAIALRLGHRASVDFDFFSHKPLDRQAIKAAFPFMAQSTTRKDESNTWSVDTPYGDADGQQVQVSFFGAIGFGRVGEPDFTDDGVMQVASFDDLMATKLKVMFQRAEAKDYRDVAALLKAGVSLSHGLASARLFFGPNFQPGESLKLLTYFQDGDLKTLTVSEKSTLTNAVKTVRDLPDVALQSNSLSVDKPAAEMTRSIGIVARLPSKDVAQASSAQPQLASTLARQRQTRVKKKRDFGPGF